MVHIYAEAKFGELSRHEKLPDSRADPGAFEEFGQLQVVHGITACRFIRRPVCNMKTAPVS